MNSSNPI